MPDVSAAARCEPTEEYRHERYHWLVDSKGEKSPARWDIDEWWGFGWEQPDSPEELARQGYRWFAVAAPPAEGGGA